MFINNSESGLDKIFQSCRITLQHSGFVNLLPRIYGHVIQGGDGGRGGQWQKSARPQNLEPSHAIKIVRQLLIFVKGTRANFFRRCALSPTNRKVFFPTPVLPYSAK